MRRVAALAAALIAVSAAPASADVPAGAHLGAHRLVARMLPGAQVRILPSVGNGKIVRIVLPKGTANPNRPGAYGPVWRAQLAAAELRVRDPGITALQIRGPHGFASGDNLFPGLGAPTAALDSVSLYAARQQLDDNLAVIAAGVPASAALRWHVETIRLDVPRHRFGFAVQLHVADFRLLHGLLGDLVVGPGIGLAPLVYRIDGLSVELRDDHAHVLGSWGTARVGGALMYPADGSCMCTSLPFHNHFGGPSQESAIHG